MPHLSTNSCGATTGCQRLAPVPCRDAAAHLLPLSDVLAAAAASAILPPSLTALNVLTVKLGNHCLNLAELTALQHLFSQDSREDAAWLSQLQLPLLTHLSLR